MAFTISATLFQPISAMEEMKEPPAEKIKNEISQANQYRNVINICENSIRFYKELRPISSPTFSRCYSYNKIKKPKDGFFEKIILRIFRHSNKENLLEEKLNNVLEKLPQKGLEIVQIEISDTELFPIKKEYPLFENLKNVTVIGLERVKFNQKSFLEKLFDSASIESLKATQLYGSPLQTLIQKTTNLKHLMLDVLHPSTPIPSTITTLDIWEAIIPKKSYLKNCKNLKAVTISPAQPWCKAFKEVDNEDECYNPEELLSELFSNNKIEILHLGGPSSPDEKISVPRLIWENAKSLRKVVIPAFFKDAIPTLNDIIERCKIEELKIPGITPRNFVNANIKKATHLKKISGSEDFIHHIITELNLGPEEYKIEHDKLSGHYYHLIIYKKN